MRAGPHRPDRLGLDPEVVWGVYAGDCIADEHWHDPKHVIEGHAHVKGPWRGWICIPSPSRVLTRTGRPSQLLLHEVAHLMVGTIDHGVAWRNALRTIGGGAEARRYERNPAN